MPPAWYSRSEAAATITDQGASVAVCADKLPAGVFEQISHLPHPSRPFQVDSYETVAPHSNLFHIVPKALLAFISVPLQSCSLYCFSSQRHSSVPVRRQLARCAMEQCHMLFSALPLVHISPMNPLISCRAGGGSHQSPAPVSGGAASAAGPRKDACKASSALSGARFSRFASYNRSRSQFALPAHPTTTSLTPRGLMHQ